MKALTVRGSFRGYSGHDHHVREFVRQLHCLGVHVQLLDFADWAPGSLAGSMRDPWFETLDEPVEASVCLHFCMPHQVEPVADMLNANFTMFEASRIPRHWVEHSLQRDRVVLPTESSRRAWVDSGCPEERIRLCPLGVDPGVFRPDVEPLPLEDVRGCPFGDYRVRLLNVSDLVPRKNLLRLLRVWIEATDVDDDAVLVVKLGCGSWWWLRKFMRSVKKMEKQLGKRREDAAPLVLLVNQVYAEVDMPRLYTSVTHYWSMSRGEGWDQPMMEAGASGRQLIAPRHSAYTTYLDDSVAHLLPARQEPAVFRWSDGLHELFRGTDWWEPDAEAAAMVLRRIIDDPEVEQKQSARARFAQQYTWERAALCLIEILDELWG